jgi:cell shape-determining protein MreD
MRRVFVLLVCLIVLEALAYSSMLGTVQDAVSQLCTSLKSLLPVAVMMMLILGGVIYAAGQMLGAETRARANVWATACLTGALIAILIVVVAQPVLQTIYGSAGTISCDIPGS